MRAIRATQPPTTAETHEFPRHRVPPRLVWALLIVLVFHGSLLLSGSFAGTYDAYVHMFLGDHYARDWFSTWEQRWYTGFTTVSYPPGTHMAIAAISKVTGSLGSAFVVVQTSALLLLTVGMYRYSRIWVDERAAGNAAILLALSSSIAETVHVFGQLPTTFALAFLLNAIPYLRTWVFGGRLGNLFIGVLTLAACTAGHHVTTLFGSIFFLGPVIVAGLLAQSRIPREGESSDATISISRRTARALATRRLKRIGPAALRLLLVGVLCIVTLVAVVLPYWLWSGSDPINQVSIPHGSRANFWSDKNLGLVFFVIPWGVLIFALPYAIVRALADRMWPLAASIGLLFVLGTGGTTPIPRMLLGGAFDILTLDRFTFWATMQILPLAGLLVSSVENGAIASWLRETGGPALLRGTQVVGVVALVGMALFAANLSAFRPFQPEPIDNDPIVAFLEKDQHERWRFMTLGFGDQMAALSAATTATQVDGNYHSARRLPELTSTSVERLEGAKYRGISGLGSLQQFLEVPEKYHLKFVFSNDRFYDPLLQVLGWERLGPLENGIDVWEKADVEPLPAVLPVKELPGWQRFLWGTVPPAAIVLASLLLLSRFVFSAPEEIGLDAAENEPNLPSPIVLNLRQLLSEVPTPTARNGRRSVIALAACLIAAMAVATIGEEPTPEETVEAYYDHLDFRRWTDAYDLLDPDTRPSYELWRLQFSVTGGLLSSYAKLDAIETTNVSLEASRSRVSANLRYITALDWYPVERPHDLVKRGKSWFLLAELPDLTTPPDQLVRRSEVDFAIQGRRRVTSLNTELTDVQDRPEIDVDAVRLMDMAGLPVVVGEVANRDVDPADVTITAVLRNAEGAVLARYNATDHLIRTLNPRESTPFRIDFQRVAAGANLDFDPLDVQPVELTDEIASVEVYGKAVVTTQGLYRGLGVNSLALEQLDEDFRLSGSLRNDGVTEAIVPILIISYLDGEGEVLWVERRFVEESVRPQRSIEFSFEIPELGNVEPSEIEPIVYANGIDDARTPLRRNVGLIDAPTGSAFASLRVDVTTIVASEVVE